MQSLAVNGYTEAEVIDVLHSAARHISFRYDLLDNTDAKIKALETVTSARVSVSSLADIKRTAKFTLEDDGTINFLTDRIQPFIRIKMPDGGFAEWSQGIYLLCSAERTESNGNIYRDVDGYDGNQVLLDDKFEDRYSIASGANYITAIKTILTAASITKTNLAASTLTLPAAKEWEPGISKLKAINELLAQMNYVPLYVDESGYYTSMAYVNPQLRSAEYTYANDEFSVIYNGLVDSIDLFSVPNKFIAYTSSADTATLRSTYTNDSASSPLSTVNKGRTITYVEKVDGIADQATLDAYVLRLAYEKSQVYGYLNIETAIMPFHSVLNVLLIQNSNLHIYEKYEETNWSYDLKAGAKMKHVLRKVVNIL